MASGCATFSPARNRHIVPHARPGNNSYRNLVSCCFECITQKGETATEDFLRTLYRLRRITSVELEGRLRALDALAAGELRPILAPVLVPRKGPIHLACL